MNRIPHEAGQVPTNGHAVEDASRLFETAVPEFASGEWTYAGSRVKGIVKQRKKQIVHYRLSYRDQLGQDRTTEVIGKVYGSDRGAKAFEVLQRLWEAGFRAPSRLRVPRAYGYSPEAGTLLQGVAPGLDWATGLKRERHDIAQTSERAADWLVALQESGVCGEAVPGDEVKSTRLLVADLGSAHPVWAALLDDLGRALESKLIETRGACVPSHGDYHPKNVFLTPQATTVIDFDTFGSRCAAYDVGYAIGQLLVMSYFRSSSFEAGVSAGEAFWRRYCAEGGRADWGAVSARVARTFLQSMHYELCTLHNGRTGLLELWSRMAQLWLSSDGVGTFEDTLRNF